LPTNGTLQQLLNTAREANSHNLAKENKVVKSKMQ